MVSLLTQATGSSDINVLMIAFYVLIFGGILAFIFLRNRKKTQSKKTTQCPNCGRTNYGKVRSCMYCGADMESKNVAELGRKKCPNCGFKAETNVVFCPGCGKQL